MTRSTPPVSTPPGPVLNQVENNPFLRKVSASLSKRWSYARMETLYEIFDLGAAWWALGRDADALAVAAAVAEALPAPPPLPKGGVNYNLWCPATFSHALIVRLDPQGSGRSLPTLVSDPGIARSNPDYVARGIQDAPAALAKAAADPSMKWGCQALARTLGKLLLYAALAKAADPMVKGFEEAIEKAIRDGRSLLGARLTAAK